MKFSVKIIESERGWGQRVDEVCYFESADEAWEFYDSFNAKNNKEHVPDWYMYAEEPKRVK